MRRLWGLLPAGGSVAPPQEWPFGMEHAGCLLGFLLFLGWEKIPLSTIIGHQRLMVIISDKQICSAQNWNHVGVIQQGCRTLFGILSIKKVKRNLWYLKKIRSFATSKQTHHTEGGKKRKTVLATWMQSFVHNSDRCQKRKRSTHGCDKVTRHARQELSPNLFGFNLHRSAKKTYEKGGGPLKKRTWNVIGRTVGLLHSKRTNQRVTVIMIK